MKKLLKFQKPKKRKTIHPKDHIQKHKNETAQEPLEYYKRLRHQEEYEI